MEKLNLLGDENAYKIDAFCDEKCTKCPKCTLHPSEIYKN